MEDDRVIGGVMGTLISARAVIVEKDQILLAKLLARPIYFLPGGTLENGETLEKCLIRELQEELGVDSWHIESYLGVINHIWFDGQKEGESEQHIYHVTSPRVVDIVPGEGCARDGITLEWVLLSRLNVISGQLKPPALMGAISNWMAGNREEWRIVDREDR